MVTDIKKLIMHSIKDAKYKTIKSLTAPDYSIIQAVTTIDDYNDIINRIYERLFIWYDYYFPEIKDILTIEEYAKFVKSYDFSENVDFDFLSVKKIKTLTTLTKNRVGAEPDKVIHELLKSIAGELLLLCETTNRLEKYIELQTTKIAPNMCSLVPAIVVARLIKHSGGLRKLAMKPASTIQVFGAEKALFKHLKTGTAPPKHGVIFQIVDIAKSQRSIRGKVSRLYATQLAIAAKADAFTGNDISAILKKEITQRIKRIKQNEQTKQAKPVKQPKQDKYIKQVEHVRQTKPYHYKQDKYTKQVEHVKQTKPHRYQDSYAGPARSTGRRHKFKPTDKAKIKPKYKSQSKGQPGRPTSQTRHKVKGKFNKFKKKVKQNKYVTRQKPRKRK